MPVRSYAISFASIGLLATLAPAALIVGNPVSAPTMPADLTSAGTLDWADWNSSSDTGVSSMAPTHRMSGGAAIGNATAVSGTNLVRGSSAATAVRVAFSNGAGGATATDLALKGVFNSGLNTNGNGVQVNVTLPEAGQYEVSVWVSGFNGRGVFTAALPGPVTYTDNTFTYTASKAARLYELDVTADTASVLNLRYVLSNTGNSSSHMLLAAVAVSQVPEPASLGLLGLAGTAMLARRRRTPKA